jgi:hypothetical protein
VGAAVAALALAGWAVFQELRTRRRLRDIDAEIMEMKAAQADILRMLERTEQQRRDLLFGYAMGMVAFRAEAKRTNEPPEDNA